MTSLRIIPLGGLGEIGMNLMVYEYGAESILVDCGMMFPDAATMAVASSGSMPPNQPLPMWYGSDMEV